jgi:murein DD-endopeptidase MepM/ murein hydrolase activator NlpD
MKVSVFCALNRVLLGTLLLCSVAACTQEPAALEMRHGAAKSKPDFSPKQDINLVTPYKINVKRGQTLYQIAREHEVSIRELIEINKVRPPYRLEIGQQIQLPKPTYHMVKSGDTATDIARGYKIDVGQLVRANNLRHPYTLQIDQKLKIPGHHVDTESTETEIDERTQPVALQNREVKTTSLQPVSQPTDVSPVTSAPLESQPDAQSQSYSQPQEQFQSQSIHQSQDPIQLQPEPEFQPQPDNVSKSVPNQPVQFIWPVKGEIISSFGPKKGGLQNDGINIKATEGNPVAAAEAGTVVYAGNELKGYGNLLLIKHHDGYLSAYAHTQKMLVSKGDAVSKGQQIATVGSTGHVNSSQLHFSIRKGRTAVNPVSYLSR